MKEICGYKGLDNQFYETEKECILADKKFKLKDLRRTLDDLPSQIQDNLIRYRRTFSRAEEFHRYEGEIMLTVAEIVLRNSDKFVEIINNKKALEADLDYLEKEINNFNKPWYLKTIWWK